jgi:dTDP-4-dehydrorhamnose 3,5-epimerase-like enzyme
MTSADDSLWKGIDGAARSALSMRDYATRDFAQQLSDAGLEAGKLTTADRARPEVREAWIPGIEIFQRTIYPQRHRGSFGEFVRRGEGLLSRIGFWPKQWASARMFAQTAKGFHVHPPSVPDGVAPEEWMRRLFVEEPENFSLRRYDEEQWDVMFFPQGVVEMLLHDVRAGLPRRTMRFWIDGDNHRGPNNVGVVIAPGVAHAIRVEGSEDAIMVYGTSTSFRPEFEGRIASEIETATLPQTWQQFLAR